MTCWMFQQSTKERKKSITSPTANVIENLNDLFAFDVTEMETYKLHSDFTRYSSLNSKLLFSAELNEIKLIANIAYKLNS